MPAQGPGRSVRGKGGEEQGGDDGAGGPAPSSPAGWSAPMRPGHSDSSISVKTSSLTGLAG